MVSKYLYAAVLIVLLSIAPPRAQARDEKPAPPVKIIFDTDIGNDVDDVLALCVLHGLQTRAQCDLLAVTITKPDELAGPFVDAIDTFYGRPEIPIGFTRAGLTNEPSKYLSIVNTTDDKRPRFPHSLKRSSEAPAAVTVLRQALSRQPDGSVVLVQVGFFSNYAALLGTPADKISPLSGRELVSRKVRLLSIMGGAFSPDLVKKHYREYNVVNDIPAAQKLAREWPSPIVWSGSEIGRAVLFPFQSIEQDFRYAAHHPAVEAYDHYLPLPYNRPCWDLTSALYAVAPGRGYFTLSPAGKVRVDADGFTRFEPEANGRDRFLILKPNQIARVKEALVELASEPPPCLGH